jgi:hypothetical protein
MSSSFAASFTSIFAESPPILGKTAELRPFPLGGGGLGQGEGQDGGGNVVIYLSGLKVTQQWTVQERT